MFAFTFAGVGQGKSIDLARNVLFCLDRSIKIQKKYHLPPRKQLCNFHVNPEVMKKYAGQIIYWTNPLDMIFEDYPDCKKIRRDFDCHWDELAVELASDKWKETHPEIRRFFAQHRKRGIEIFGNTQDYMMLDINARRMATNVFTVKKIIGSRDISATLPPVKKVWGVICKWEIDKKSIEMDNVDYKRLSIIPSVFFINKTLTDFYDTTEDIKPAGYDDLKHVVKICKVCGYKKITHQ